MRIVQEQLARLHGVQLPELPDLRSVIALNILNLVVVIAFGVTSVGLLLRHRWSRRAYLVLLIVNLVAMVSTSVISHMNLSVSLSQSPGMEGVGGTGPIGYISLFVGILALTFGLVISGVLTWKLTRPEIRAEFESNHS